MILLEHRTTGEGVLVESTTGYDLAAWRVVTTNASGFDGKRWDSATQTFVDRAKPASEVTQETLQQDPRWQALQSATPAEIDAFLSSNVPDAGTRRVLRVLILAVQILARTRD